MVIDFHVHMFPDALAEKTIPLLAKRSGMEAHSDGTAGMTLQKMEKSGVSYAVVQNIATNPRQMAKVNDFAISLKKHQNLIPFGSVHPLAEDIESELDRLKDSGILGVKLHPDYQEFFIDDPKMQRIYEAILKRDFVLLFHTGVDIGLPEPVHARPEAISHILGLFSGEKVVFAHMAGFRLPEESLRYVIGRDVYIDTSCSAGYVEEELLVEMLSTHPADKILFATDFPWGDFGTEIDNIRRLPLSEGLKEKFFYQNAKELLNLE